MSLPNEDAQRCHHHQEVVRAQHCNSAATTNPARHQTAPDDRRQPLDLAVCQLLIIDDQAGTLGMTTCRIGNALKRRGGSVTSRWCWASACGSAAPASG